MNPAFPHNFESQDYVFLETANIDGNGKTDIYKKTVYGVEIMLSCYMEDDFGSRYLLASLYVCKDLYPKDNLRHPLLTSHIEEICGEYLTKLSEYETTLIKAAKASL